MSLRLPLITFITNIINKNGASNMDIKTANRRIQELYGNLNEQNAGAVLQELETLYSIKPVGVMWYMTKAKALAMLGQIVESYGVIGGKYTSTDIRDCLLEIYDIYVNNAALCNDIDNVWRNKYLKDLTALYFGKKAEFETANELLNQVQEANTAILKEKFSPETVADWQRLAYRIQELVIANMFEAYAEKNNLERGLQDWVSGATNTGYIRECLLKSKACNIIVMEAEDELEHISQVVASLCAGMGHNVYYIRMPENTNGGEDMEKMLAMSIDGVCDKCGYKEIQSYENEQTGDNRDYILKYLYEKEFPNSHALCFCTGNLMEVLSIQPSIRKNFQRITNYYAAYLEMNINCAWIGSYTSYISDIYDFDVAKKIEAKGSCRFSIVIPARNSAYTLKETVKTCLNQDYDGKYEIILSDNSTDNNTQVYELYKSLGDDRVKYYKTPRNLHLPKSFEYACLMAQGEYILAMGSDDGLLPWTLKVLDEVIEKHPDESIIQWQRGFYAWPGFNKNQQNEFKIPVSYKKEYTISYMSKEDYFANVLTDSSKMYMLPMLYINSCFKRDYYKVLLDRTGRLWDGTCQDIYMGLVNIAINDRILNIDYPLSIAGMSESSIGAQANRPKLTDEGYENDAREIILDGNVGGYALSYYERLVPPIGTDTWSFYTSLLRLVSIGVWSQEYLDVLFDWKNIFVRLLAEININDVVYDRKIAEMTFSAYLHGEDFFNWYEENLLPVIEKRQDLPDKVTEEKEHSYEIGKDATGGITLDASCYDVHNIWEAACLFEKIMKEGY